MNEYTKEGLQEVTKAKLYDLAEYYDLDVSYRMKKDVIIDVILEFMNRHIPKPEVVEDAIEYQEEEEGLPPMSVQIRRIYEANRK